MDIIFSSNSTFTGVITTLLVAKTPLTIIGAEFKIFFMQTSYIIYFSSFPMELHMVFFNRKYDNFMNSLKHKDGLAVLAFFYEASPTT